MFVLAKLTDGVRVHAVRPDVVTFNVLDSMDPAGARGSFPADWPATAVRPRLEWESERRAETPFEGLRPRLAIRPRILQHRPGIEEATAM